MKNKHPNLSSFVLLLFLFSFGHSQANCDASSCSYSIAIEKAGFYVSTVRLPLGASEGFWGLQVKTSSGKNAGGFNSGAVLGENGKYPGFTAFYLSEPEAIDITAFKYTTASSSSSSFNFGIKKQNLATGERSYVYGPFETTSGQKHQTPILEAGFYVSEVFSLADSPRGRFGITLNGNAFTGGVNIGGWIDDKTGGNGEGFAAFYIPEAQTVDFKLFFGQSYGEFGSAQPSLNVYYQNSEGNRVLQQAFVSSALPVDDDISFDGTPRLNDTGITSGRYDLPEINVGGRPNQYGSDNTCTTGKIIIAQDCSHGRDATHNDYLDGIAGFSFSRIDSGRCVQDNVTGLMWEVKQGGNGARGDEGLHDADDFYNWYDTNPATNGGADGYADDDKDICYGYQSGNPSTYCNTQAYVARVNSEGWCGYKDWRMPNREELRSIVTYAQYSLAIDRWYFPNISSDIDYWSGSPYAYDSNDAWFVSFYGGYSYYRSRHGYLHVRLVRGGQ